ncbi:EF-hand domain-containing protein [Ruegeria arenilitoris]|uniref:EF-hand domain-containing protein n=1 Tax=Ruegeria arenilitoris TaxID=1173585 RepID=UPI0014799DEF|nr:EF-hand domain-containing protein [Ruegeria arenilitoris]
MARQLRIDEIEELWEQIAGNLDVIPLDDLQRAVAAFEEPPVFEHLNSLPDAFGSTDAVTREQFLATIASLSGDLNSRLTIAFDVFDENRDGQITPEELQQTLLAFGISKTRIDHYFAVADKDGDGAIDFDEFCNIVSNVGQRHPNAYRDIHLSHLTRLPIHKVASRSSVNIPRALSSNSAARPRGEGSSRLQIQIGLFRLLQGAAYRSFRENFAANYETHLTAKIMPYSITEFAKFTDSAIALYKALGIVEPSCFEVLDAVPRSIREELERLDERIASWPLVEKTLGMLAEVEKMEEEREDKSKTRHVFEALVECALTLRRKNLAPADLFNGALDLHEVKRLRAMELYQDRSVREPRSHSAPLDYLQAWNRVIVDSVEEEIDGAMMPSRYWYEDYMPKLLAACSIGTAEDIDANTNPNEADLDNWFAAARASGEFHPFANAEMECFKNCRPSQKLMIKQAWQLTRHYLNGVQKQRERLEFGRETGSLSQYVAFLDVYLGRSDVRDADMRLSFPYFIGPATWRFLHTTAEIVCSRDDEDQKILIALFKDFFRSFAAMYPCPYCRYHLNRYVVRNCEVEFYPLEFLLLGCDQGKDKFEATIENKLSTITDGRSLRLFLWKLHNAVSSSITRTESWFHRDEHSFYASRYWPSLNEELACARAFGRTELPVDRLSHLSGLLRPVGRLASLRGRWRGMQTVAATTQLATFIEDSHGPVRDLEEALAAGEFLEKTYRFDPTLKDDEPHFTPEEVAYSRSGLFVEA